MSRHDHPLSPEQRRYELATILGRGLRRLLPPRACDAVLPPPCSSEKLSKSGEVSLEVLVETRLSVSRVDASQDT
jgi:hypothetical protein